MIPSGLFTQIALVALSIGVIFTYIMPTFEDISVSQEQISVYQSERDKVDSVNQTLAAKLAQINGVNSNNLERLRVYMPDQVDPIAVMRDIETITAASGAELVDVTDSGAVDSDSSNSNFNPETYGSEDPFSFTPQSSTVAGPYPYAFTLSVEGTYSQIKTLISTLEKNDYPIEIQQLRLSSEEGGFLSAEFTLYTYSKDSMTAAPVQVYQDVNVTYE